MSLRILIVDDEPNILRLIGYTLHRAGYEVIPATNGAEALNKAETEKPNLLILDVMLPDMSGLEVCKALRQKPESVGLPIIMLSALGQPTNKIDGLDAGADMYATKPILPEELLATVKSILGRTKILSLTKPKNQGLVVGCMGAKGGVGTTTLVLNLAAVLAGQGAKVVAAEMKPSFGTFSAQLNLDPRSGVPDLLDLNPNQISERQIDTSLIDIPSGFKVLVGPQNVDQYRELEPPQVTSMLTTTASMADYLLLDLPSCPSEANKAAVSHCNLLLILVEPEATCMASARVNLKLLKTWGISGRLVGIVVVNRVPLGNPIVISEIETRLEHNILGVIPPTADALIAAQRMGVPLVVSHNTSVAASAFIDVAKKIRMFDQSKS